MNATSDWVIFIQVTRERVQLSKIRLLSSLLLVFGEWEYPDGYLDSDTCSRYLLVCFICILLVVGYLVCTSVGHGLLGPVGKVRLRGPGLVCYYAGQYKTCDACVASGGVILRVSSKGLSVGSGLINWNRVPGGVADPFRIFLCSSGWS